MVGVQRQLSASRDVDAAAERQPLVAGLHPQDEEVAVCRSRALLVGLCCDSAGTCQQRSRRDGGGADDGSGAPAGPGRGRGGRSGHGCGCSFSRCVWGRSGGCGGGSGLRWAHASRAPGRSCSQPLLEGFGPWTCDPEPGRRGASRSRPVGSHLVRTMPPLLEHSRWRTSAITAMPTLPYQRRQGGPSCGSGSARGAGRHHESGQRPGDRVVAEAVRQPPG